MFDEPGDVWVGRGTGVDDSGLARKAAAVDAGLERHEAVLADPLRVAAALGGRELAAMLGATLSARLRKVPVLLDGFVVTAAVAPLASIDPAALDHVQAAHVSAETPHRRLLDLLGLSPLLDLGMRLGEASGACLAVNLVRSACACFAGMASFDGGGRFGQRGPLRTSPVRWRTNAQRKDNCSISAFLPLWALERARGGPAQGVDVQAGRAALTVRSRGLAA